jgi:sporulation protein YlmC with PRC-barrel domain
MVRHAAFGLALIASVAAPPAWAQQPAGSPADPHLSVAAVKLDNGYRASKIIGASVYNDQNQQVGTVSDLYLSKQNQIVMAVLSVGSFLGIGGKLVSVPFDKLQMDDKEKLTLPGGSKDSLSKMPNVEYGG